MAAPENNNNAEKWTEKEAETFLIEAVNLSKDIKFDFIGEVAKQQNSYKEIYNYLTDKFPRLKNLAREIKSNCEVNCFYNGKKGNIIASLAIMNLKSNHGWTDRLDQTTNGKELNINIPVDKWINED